MEASWISVLAGSALWQFCAHIVLLTGTAVGGGMIAVMPDVHRFVVETNHWVTSEQFTATFAMAQASPGPNFMYVALIGWHIAGWTGAVAGTIAVALPPALICYAVLRIGSGRGGGVVQRAFRRGLVPLSAGLLLASGWVLANTVDDNWRAGLMTAVFVVLLLKTRVHPLWLIATGATLGLMGWV